MTLIPTLRYADPRAAIDFLTGVVGLRAGAVATDADGAVQHAELWSGDAPVLLGPTATGDAFATGRAVLYLVDADPDARHATAVAAGAEIVMGLTDQPYGSREFALADPEGNVWSIGTYRPTPP